MTSLSNAELTHALGVAKSAAARAAMLIMGGYRRRPRTEKKGEIDLVTDFDLASEELIRTELSSAFPDHLILGEESEAPKVDENGSRFAWYVDPIDGTTNFSHGHPFFAVSIALCENEEPIVGVVHAPALSVVWSGARGLGAYRDEIACQVSATAGLDDALCATGFPYDRRTSEENNFAEFSAVKRRARGVRRCGAAAIDLALVADGTYDAYWEQKLKPWDVAAGVLLVREAGGRVSGYSGAPFRLNAGKVVASNTVLHEELGRVLDDARNHAKLIPS